MTLQHRLEGLRIFLGQVFEQFAIAFLAFSQHFIRLLMFGDIAKIPYSPEILPIRSDHGCGIPVEDSAIFHQNFVAALFLALTVEIKDSFQKRFRIGDEIHDRVENGVVVFRVGYP